MFSSTKEKEVRVWTSDDKRTWVEEWDQKAPGNETIAGSREDDRNEGEVEWRGMSGL